LFQCPSSPWQKSPVAVPAVDGASDIFRRVTNVDGASDIFRRVTNEHGETVNVVHLAPLCLGPSDGARVMVPEF
jgi:hypothetical protein